MSCTLHIYKAIYIRIFLWVLSMMPALFCMSLPMQYVLFWLSIILYKLSFGMLMYSYPQDPYMVC